MQQHSEANAKWENQLQDVQQSNEYNDLFVVEFEWNIFPELTTLQILQKIQDKERQFDRMFKLKNYARRFPLGH